MADSRQATETDFVVPEKRHTVVFNGVRCSDECMWQDFRSPYVVRCSLFREDLIDVPDGLGRCRSCFKAEKAGGVIDD